MPAQFGSSSSGNICRSLDPSDPVLRWSLVSSWKDVPQTVKDTLDSRDWCLLGVQGFLMSGSNVEPERKRGPSILTLQGHYRT